MKIKLQKRTNQLYSKNIIFYNCEDIVMKKNGVFTTVISTNDSAFTFCRM
jgi:hypothetical protein